MGWWVLGLRGFYQWKQTETGCEHLWITQDNEATNPNSPLAMTEVRFDFASDCCLVRKASHLDQSLIFSYFQTDILFLL